MAHPLHDQAQGSTQYRPRSHPWSGNALPHSQDSCTHIARQCIPPPLQVAVRVITKTLPQPIYKKSSHPLQDNVPTPMVRQCPPPSQDSGTHIARQCIHPPPAGVCPSHHQLPQPIYKKNSHPLQDNVPHPLQEGWPTHYKTMPH